MIFRFDQIHAKNKALYRYILIPSKQNAIEVLVSALVQVGAAENGCMSLNLQAFLLILFLYA